MVAVIVSMVSKKRKNLQMLKFYNYFLLFVTFVLANQFMAVAQYPGPVGALGSTALHKDTNLFKAWAVSCSISRGFQNIEDSLKGKATVGSPENALGKAGEQGGVVSLGDGGTALLTFAKPITNGPGADFAVFENGFSDEFLELAFVEVSSDGLRFVRFPAVSLTQNNTQIGPFDYKGKAEFLHNLSGKYRLFYGTPFDLEELKDSTGIRIDSINYIRIVDVVGSINPAFGTRDSRGSLINDPFPTVFSAGGFDLDAVGVIHEKQEMVPQFPESKVELPQKEEEKQNAGEAIIYPNPALEFLFLNKNTKAVRWKILDGLGRVILSGQKIKEGLDTKIEVSALKSGCYYFEMEGEASPAKPIRFYKQ